MNGLTFIHYFQNEFPEWIEWQNEYIHSGIFEWIATMNTTLFPEWIEWQNEYIHSGILEWIAVMNRMWIECEWIALMNAAMNRKQDITTFIQND